MPTLDWPRDLTWRPISGKFQLVPVTHISQSPYTGSLKAILLQQIWHAELTYNNHELGVGEDIQAFIDQFEGGANPVRMFDPWRTRPRLLSTAKSGFSDGTFFDDGTGFTDGYSLGVLTAAIKGASQIAVAGFPVSQAVLKAGDLLSINGYLYQTRYGASSNSSGQALITIQPGLRAGIAAGDVVITDYATAPMTLLSGLDAIVPRTENYTSGFTLTFVELIP